MLKLVFIAAALSITLSGCGLFSKTPQSVSNAFQKLERPKSALATKYEALIPDITQSNSWEDPIDIVSLSNLKVLGNLKCWNTSNIFQSGNQIITDPVSTSGNTFIMTKSGHVKSYSNKDRKLDWSYDLGFNLKDVRNASATLMHKDAKLYVTVHQHFIVLSAKDGSEIFYKKLSNKITSGVCVAEDIAYFNDVSNLYAVDISSGRILYTSPGIANSLVIESKTQPAFYESNALFSNHFCGQLTLVDTKQIGQPLLQIPIPFAKKGPINLFMPSLISQPIIDKNNSCIYLASHTGMIQKYDIKKECVIWSKNIHSLQRLSKIGNTLVAITLARQAIAINSLNGEIVWVADLELNPKILHEFLAPLCINGNLVLLSRNGNLIELNPQNGQVLFCTNIKLKNAISMSVVNDKLRIYTENKVLENN